MKKLIFLLVLISSCSQWVAQEEQDISNYRYDVVPSEEKKDAN